MYRKIVPGSVLASVPASCVRIELLDHGLVLVGVREICPCAGAGHRGAEEHVDNQHEEEEDPEHDAQIQEP